MNDSKFLSIKKKKFKRHFEQFNVKKKKEFNCRNEFNCVKNKILRNFFDIHTIRDRNESSDSFPFDESYFLSFHERN